MKVILTQDVKSLGKKGEVVNVSDGYARNYILPKGLGLEADAKNLNDLKLQKASEAKKAKQLLEAAQEMAKELEGREVVLKIKPGKDGKVFGSISSKEIAAAAKQQCSLELDKKKIQLTEPIKALGAYEVGIKLHPQVTGKLKVNVVEE